MDKDKLDQLASQVLPKGFKLTADRGHTAKIVLDPNSASQFERWSKNTNKTDLKGYDTKQTSKRAIMKDISLGYIESEADRLTREGQESNRVIDSVADLIKDRQSMEEAIKNAFEKHKSLFNLVGKKAEIKSADWDALFMTKKIQDIIKNNNSSLLINYIKRKYNVDDQRAELVVNKLSKNKRLKLIEEASSMPSSKQPVTKIKVKKQSVQEKLGIPILKKQKSKTGTYYRRSKPRKFSSLELQFLQNNQEKPISEINKLFNFTFAKKRTLNSLRNKLYRLKKS